MKQIFTLLAFFLCGVLGYSQTVMTITVGGSSYDVPTTTTVSVNGAFDYAGATTLVFTVYIESDGATVVPTTLSKIYLQKSSDLADVFTYDITAADLLALGGGKLSKTFTIYTVGDATTGDFQVPIGDALTVMYDASGNDKDFTDTDDRLFKDNSVLPVEISSFTGRYSPKGMAVLNWTTESELNNDFFTVERSFDGRDFEAVEKIAGAGTSLESQTYQFLDHTAVSLAKSNTVYYRLKQTDFDGAFSHSDLISVELDRKDVLEVNSFVNESTGIDLYYSVPQNSKVVVSIFTTSGQQIKKETYNVEAGNNLYQADISNLPSGMYILSLQNGESILNQKFVK